VLVKVYDDIQTELQEKTAALKKMKQRVKGLNSEISDLQSEFERDRQDYLDTIRKQDQQIKLIESILDKIHPTVRKDCNYSNIEKIKAESVWSDEQSRWKVPDLVVQKTKLPPADRSFAAQSEPGESGGATEHHNPPQPQSRTAPGRLEAADTDSEEEHFNLKKKLAKGAEEDIAGNYFKPVRANRLMKQVQETQRSVNLTQSRSGGPLAGSNTNLASSFNSGLNTVGLNNGYQNQNGERSGGSKWGNSSRLDNGLSNGGGGGGSFNGINSVGSSGGYSGFKSSGGGYGDIGTIRKPTRLEALPASGPVKKKSVPLLNTMGTF